MTHPQAEIPSALHLPYAYALEQKLRPFVARRVPPADVDDVLQDVYVRVQRALPALRDQERFIAWLYQVARSAVQENLRQRFRHPLAFGSDSEQADPSDEGPESATTEAYEASLAAFAADAIAELPSPYKEALTLTELEGMTQQAAAKLLGLSPSGMRSRVQRGREKLRELLDACCKIALDARGRVIDCEPRKPTACSCREK